MPLLPWERVSKAEEFQAADPDTRDTIRRRWLEVANQENELSPEDQVRLTLRVYGNADPLGQQQVDTNVIDKGYPPGVDLTPKVSMEERVNQQNAPAIAVANRAASLMGQGAAKVGRTALKIAQAPFVPLDLAREHIAKPVLDMIPGMDTPFNYQTYDPVIGRKIMTEKGISPERQAVMEQYGAGLPEEAYTSKTAGTKSDWFAHGAEFAAMGGYTKLLGGLARKGFAPAAAWVSGQLQDLGVVEKWTKGKLAFERGGRLLNNRQAVSEAYGTGVHSRWMREVPEAQERMQIRDLIENGIEEMIVKDPPAAAKALTALQPHQQQAMAWYLGRDQARRKLGVDMKILRTGYDSYVPHVMEDLEAARSGMLFQLHRTHKMSLKEIADLAKAAGQQNPFIDDIAVADAIHEVAFQRLYSKKLFAKIVDVLKAEDGGKAVLTQNRYEKLRLLDPEAAAKYAMADPTRTRAKEFLDIYRYSPTQTVDASVIEGQLVGRQQNVFIHQDYTKQINRFLPRHSSENNVSAAVKAVLNGSRRVIMANPLVHGVNITSTVAAAAPWGNAMKVIDYFGEGGKVKRLGLAGEEPYFSTIVEAAHNGLRVPAIASSWRSANEEMMKKVLPGGNFFTKAADFSDRMLFDNIVSNPMYGMYKQVKDRWAPLIGDKEAGLVAAEYVNLNQGTIPIESFSPFMQKQGQWILFSRSWTTSNFRSLSQAVGLPWGSRHLKPQGQAVLAQEWMETWARGLAYMNIHNEVMNRAIAGHSAADNPPGHELDIDTGRSDKSGRRIYIAGSPFMYVRQMLKRAGHLADGDVAALGSDLLAPLNTWKGVGEALTNTDWFLRRPIAPPGAPAMEQVGRRAIHAVGALTPLGSTLREGMRPGAEWGETVRDILDSPEDWLRFFTYWPSHGLTYDTEVFTRLKKADKFLIMNSMSPEARQGLIGDIQYKGKIEGTAAVELKGMKDKLTYLRDAARDKALHELLRGDMKAAADVLIKGGWSMDGARTFITTKGRKIGYRFGDEQP